MSFGMKSLCSCVKCQKNPEPQKRPDNLLQATNTNEMNYFCMETPIYTYYTHHNPFDVTISNTSELHYREQMNFGQGVIFSRSLIR